jgi:predicted AAA+ superfamily ATPase
MKFINLGQWRSLVKGFYDKLKNTYHFLITGSARLDYYRKGGDSLLGRYHYYRMHPLSLPEVVKSWDSGDVNEKMMNLLEYGGFPEPYLKKDLISLRRWHHGKGKRELFIQIFAI